MPGASPGLVAIGGLARSGTTMLVHLLNTHPEVRVLNEFRCFATLDRNVVAHYRVLRGRLRGRVFQGADPGEGARRARVLKNGRFIAGYLWRLGPRWDRVRIEDVRRSLAGAFPEARVVGDKLPRYLWQFERLRAVPRMRLIAIYRDPRDVAQSTLKLKRGGWKDKAWVQNVDARRVARTWVDAMELLDGLGDDVLAIRYEDMVAEPARELGRIAAHLHVDPAGFRHDLVRRESVGKHHGYLSSEELEAIRSVAAPAMERRGYAWS